MARLICPLGLTLILSACGPGLGQSPVANSVEPMQMQVVYRGSQCPAVEPGIQVFRDTAAWTEWRRQRNRQLFSPSNEADDEATAVDFGQVTVIVISMGQKPTPGYAIEVLEDSAVLQEGSLTISSVWQHSATSVNGCIEQHSVEQGTVPLNLAAAARPGGAARDRWRGSIFQEPIP